jgi:MFS family permease
MTADRATAAGTTTAGATAAGATTGSPTAAAAIPRRALVGIFGGLFCGYTGLTAVIPVLPVYVRDRYDASDLLVGLTVTATALTALLIRPVAGNVADRRGHRLVMRAGAVILAIGGAGYFLPIGLGGLLVVRLLLGVGEAALFTGGAVWTVSLAPHERRGQFIGLYGMSMWLGISVGTFLGAALLHVGYGAVWTLSLAAPLVGLALITSVAAPARAAGATSGRGLMLRPALLPGTALALGAAGYAGLAAFVILHLQARGIHSGVVVLSTFSIVYGGTRLVIGRLPDQLGPRRCAALSGLGEAVGLVIVAVAPDLAIAIIGAVVMGVGFSLLHPSLALMVMNRTDKSRQGAALGAYTSFWDLGLAVWGPLTGIVASGFGYPAVFVVGAICAVGASVMALVIPAAAPLPQPQSVAVG